MPTLLARLDFEVPAFRYACLDDAADVAAAAAALTRASEGATVTGGVRFWEVAPLPAVDLVFSWAGLERQTLSRAFDFFFHVHRSGARLALVGNHAGVDNVVVGPPGRRRRPRPQQQRSAAVRPVPPALNVRAPPFAFDAPARVIGGFALPPSPAVAEGAHRRARQKQLVLYRADQMRRLW